MNNWTSLPMGLDGEAMPLFDHYDDSAPLSFETHFDDSYDEKSWSDPYEMTLGEFYERLSEGQHGATDAEIAPLIPMLLSALPAVVQGVSSVVSSFSRPRQAPPPPRPAAPPPQASPVAPRPRYAAPRPSFVPRPTPPPAPVPTPQAAPAPGVDNSTLATLLALISNPGLQSAVQTAAGNASIPIGGNSNLPVSAVMDIIGQLAGAVTGNEAPPSQEAYPDFLFDSYGNALVNLDSAEEIGNLLLEKFQYR